MAFTLDQDIGFARPRGGLGSWRAEAAPRFGECLEGFRLDECFAFWRDCREDGRTPLKARLDPVRMPRAILPNLFIYEAIGSRYRCRLAGTTIVTVFHEDPTGRYLDDMISPGAIAGRMRLYDTVMRTGVPVVYGGELMPASGTPASISFRRLLLPVSTTGAANDIVFGMAVFPSFDKRASKPSRVEDLPYDFEAWAAPEDLA